MRYSSLLPALLAFQPCLSAPSKPPITNTSILPTHYGLLIFPHYQALDIFSPMDLLNSLFMFYSNNTQTPHLSVLSKTMAPVTSAMMTGGFGQEILPTTTFADYLAGHGKGKDGDSTSKGDIDVLVVPGGGGTRRDMSAEIDFVKLTYPKLKYIISICTGATILSRAGVIDNKRATTNKRSWAWATSTGPNVTWVPTARWVEHGNVFTSSGVSAGTDAMYAFVSRVYGEAVAEYMSLSLEYERVVDWQHDDFARVWDVPGAV
ncbi:DJ-1/PfpI family protein [Pyrenophora teres f. maculata]|nr:DJ-1/PfpI family protein [Pyrenophora teres f. maculata]